MQFITTTIYIALAALPIVSANGCYSGGNTYAQYGSADDLNTARAEACNALTRTYCSTNGAASINFKAKSNAGSQTLTLLTDDCLAALTTEMEACAHGSEQDHGSFHYTDDPNAGAC
ncbi:hypothetical protein M406DRAFT_328028 [Cryphonectria parasitica EP155]|uniref:Uncharacterized protein n=1 Tax=Cryphonectria parasitica (strain ATCC 38755 / EP155) TaxID=660469 RepID=A0A9P4Y4Q1_CRYP1|nr:uncharacterized protein M406DRAFT_328028 [Cryphonectria parasitica EP155]KAF3766914.1 hypothetical protein M406DRAFT_328028 [Cryphonectria parasitica EP155]